MIVACRRQVELREDAPNVLLDRAFSDEEAMRDTAVGSAFGHQREHLPLASR